MASPTIPQVFCPVEYSSNNGNLIQASILSCADYETNGSIESIQLILLGASIFYGAAGDINLNAGFEVQQGADFNAIIEGCGGNN